MNSRERVETALRRGQPDRIPTFEWTTDRIVIEAMTGQADIVTFLERMDIDGLSVAPGMRKEHLDDRHYRDEWGIVRASFGEYPVVVGHPLITERDLQRLSIPDPDAEHRFAEIRALLERTGREKAVIVRLRDVFSQPRDLLGYEGFLMGFYTQPELLERLMEISVDYNTRLARNLRGLGVTILFIGDDIATNQGLLVSPELFRAVAMPHFRRLVHSFKDFGFLVAKHTDGNIMAVADDLVDAGIDCLDPIDPLGGMDLGLMKQRFGARICLKGNVDCVSTLVDKPPAEVVREVKRCILAAGAGGGYIISSSNSVHSGVRPENYRAFLDAVRELGCYPLDVEKLQSPG